MSRKFSFNSALMHFAQTEGPSGFIWKYLLVNILLTVVITAISIFLLWPIITLYLSLMQETAAGGVVDPDVIAGQIAGKMMGMIGGLLLMAPIGIAFWAMMEAAIQRRYMRSDGFKLRFGGDELRLIVVGLMWFLFIFLGYLAFAVLVGVSAGLGSVSGSEGWVIGLTAILVIIGVCVGLWVTVRLSAASALTVRDQKIQFFESWQVTKGRFWPMFGALLLLFVGYYIISIILQLVLGTGIMGALMTNQEALEAIETESLEALFAVFLTPGVLVPVGLFWIASMVIQAFFRFAWAGPAAMAARADPRSGGVHNVDEEFA